MSEAIEKLRAQSRTEITLESGRRIRGRLPRRLEYIRVAKSLPLPILDKAQEAATSPDATEAAREIVAEAGQDELLDMARALDSIVNLFVKEIEIDGEWVEFSSEDNVADELEEDECFEIVQYAQRRKPLPKASGSPSSESSPTLRAVGPTPIPVNDSALIPPGSSLTTSLP